MAEYPASIYSPRAKANKPGILYDPTKTTRLYAEDISKDDAEIVAVETELGTNPKGAYADVKARLEADESAISVKPDSFLELSDAPASYSGEAGKVVKVNAGETGLEFGEAAAGGTPCPFVNLTGVSYPRVFGSDLAIGDNDLYTVPAGKRAMFYYGRVYNPSAGSVTFYLEAKISGTYYQIIDTTTRATGTGSSFALSEVLVLEAGESISINCATTAGLNVAFQCVEFNNTDALKTSRVLGLVNGNNTIYTVPAGKKALLFRANIFSSGNIAVFNRSGGSRSYILYCVPSGSSAGTKNQLYPATVLADVSGTSYSISSSLDAGDYIVLNTNSGASIQIAWVTVVEI